MTPESGPADIHEPEPVVAPVTPLPPPSAAAPAPTPPAEAPAAPAAAPRTLGLPPTEPAPAAAPEPEQPPAAAPAQAPAVEQPAAPAGVPDPRMVERHEQTLAALLSANDEHAARLDRLERQVRGLGRNDLLLAGAIGGLVFLLARESARAAIDGSLADAGELGS